MILVLGLSAQLSFASELGSQDQCLDQAQTEFRERQATARSTLKASMDLCDSPANNGIEDRCYLIAARKFEGALAAAEALLKADQNQCLH